MRIGTWLHRTENCRKPSAEQFHGELTPEGLTQTEERVIRDTLYEAYSNEIKALIDLTFCCDAIYYVM